MSTKREPFLESITDLLGKQNAVISLLQDATGFDKGQWLDFMVKFGDASKGFIEEDTLQLLFILDEYKLYDVPSLLLSLKQKLIRDFNSLRKVFVEKGLLAKEFVRPRTTLSDGDAREWGT